MKFYTKTQKKKMPKQTDLLNFVSKETKNQLAWEMINNGADVNEVFQKIGFSLDDHLQLNALKDVSSNQSDRRLSRTGGRDERGYYIPDE